MKYSKFWKLSTGFCAFGFWTRKLCDNTFNYLSNLYIELEMFFDFEVWVIKMIKTMRQLSLFSVCMHLLRYFRSCDKMPKSK